ncbi:MAG: InlB B-repeat-containing protein [Treponema sp.]|nr:InlB B-repeat-containing protein [Treponema sp.]
MKKVKLAALLVIVISLRGLLTCSSDLPGSSGPEYCTISFNTDGGAPSIANIQVEKGKSMGGQYPSPSKTGYTFDGWYDESLNPPVKYEVTDKITKNLTLKAHWTGAKYTVTFNKNTTDEGSTDASPKTMTVTSPTTIGALPEAPTRTGYGFIGWFDTDDETGGTKFTVSTTVNGNITVYARWDADVYTVTFNKNTTDEGNTDASPKTMTVTSPTTIDELPAPPARIGYTFTGWNTQADGLGTPFVQTTTVSASVTVYAQWTVNTLTISYANGGGTGPAPTSPTSAVYGANVTMPANPYSLAGYTFAGWEVSGTNSTPSTYAAGASVAVTALSTGINTGNATITLTAAWTANAVYTVTFNKNTTDSGSTDASPSAKTVTVPATNIDALPAPPTRIGYTFNSWNTQANGAGTTFVQTTTVSANITVYAQWNVNTLTINYANGGGTGPAPTSPTSAAYGANVTMPANPYTRSGYTFAGWEVSGTNSTPGTHPAGASIAVSALSTGINTGNASITLTAAWTANAVYTVTFNKNGGDTDASPSAKTVTVPVTTIDALPTAPARIGYTFNSWNTQANGAGTTFVQTTTVSANITVYAQWTAILSGNAAMRAAPGTLTPAIDAFSGLYIGGIPATSIGNPGTDKDNYTGTTAPAPTSAGAIASNSVTGAVGKPVVVIVDDANVSKVEFGLGGTNDTTVVTTWQQLTRNNDNTPSGLTGKRWITSVVDAYPTSTTGRRAYVRITAQDGTTVRVYRYTWNCTNSVRGILNSVTVGGQNAALGTVSGWWNKTVAPNLEYGTATISAGGSVAVSSDITNTSAAGTVTYARLPASTPWPLLESAASPFVDSVDVNTSTTNGVTSATVNNVANGDYILVRYIPTTANYQGYFAHALIKVTILPTWNVTFNTDGGTPSTITGIQVVKGQSMGAQFPSPDPSKPGFTFDGWYLATDTGFTGTKYIATTVITADTSLKAKWTANVVLSNNANIRAVSNAREPNGLFGLYIGGSPGINNGTPGTSATTVTGTTAPAPTANGLIGGSNATVTGGKSVVVIVEDDKVSSVAYGIATADNDTTAPPAWYPLIKDNANNIPDLTGKRWIAQLDAAYDVTASTWRRVYVRITAQDGTTVKVYRYTQYVAYSASAPRATLSALTIGGVNALSTAGTIAGWWNRTTAPDFVEGSVTLTAGGNITVNSTFTNNGISAVTSCVRIPAGTAVWPFLENTVLPFATNTVSSASTSSGTATNLTVNGVQNGDYILIRYIPNEIAGTGTNYQYNGYYAHYIVKINIPPPVDTWAVTVNPNTPYTFPKLITGYTSAERTARTVTISNSGNQPTGNLTVSLTGANSGSFEFDPSTTTTINSLATGQSAQLTVRPKTGLTAGSYNAAVSITGGNGISAGFAISVTVANHLPAYIGATADVHWGRGSESTNTGYTHIFESWMTKLGTHYSNLDYMLFAGDNGSAYTTGTTHWNNIAEFIPIADNFYPSFMLNKPLFVTGNHEWQNTAGGALLNNLNATLTSSLYPTVRAAAERLNYNNHSELVRTADYAIYAFGPKPASTPASSFQDFPLADRNELSAYLASAPTDIPIIILTHFPLHAMTTASRYSQYASETIEILNNYPNVIFLWGHNHSNEDPMYKSIQGPGYTMTTTAGTSSTTITKTINFLYVPVGTMRDADYKDGHADKIYSKGVVLEIDGKQLTFRYYDNKCEPTSQAGWEAETVYNLTGSGYVKQ